MTLVINIDHICENKSYSYNFCKFYKVAKASFVITLLSRKFVFSLVTKLWSCWSII